MLHYKMFHNIQLIPLEASHVIIGIMLAFILLYYLFIDRNH
jgi:hypothetical protein